MRTPKLLILIILFFLNPLSAEDNVWRKGDAWPCKKPVVLKSHVDVHVDYAAEQYTYRYVIANSMASERPIRSFEIDLRDNPVDGVLTLKNYVNLEDLKERSRKLYEVPRVYVFGKLSPLGWEGGGDDGGWGTDPYGGLPAGASKNNFSFTAKEPPGIREYVVNADDNEWDFFLQKLYQESPAKAAFYQNSKEFMIEANTPLEQLGKTIAPVSPSEPFTTSSWTLRMTEYAVEARKQKWITSDKVLAEINKLISGLNTGDVGKLKAAVKKTEAYVLAEKKKGSLTDEADALVRLNAQYLLKRMGSPGGKSSAGTRQ